MEEEVAPPRDTQLDWVLRLAENSRMPVWLEAGTLLGVAREGQPLAHDRDLDLGLWAEDAGALAEIAAAAAKAGYRVYRETYRGWMHKMKLFPSRHDRRTIDLQIYRRTDTHAWSPARWVPNYDYRWWAPHRVVKGAVRWPLRWWWQEHAHHVELTHWPWRRMARLWTWWVPLRLFVGHDTHAATGYPVPAAWEAYLGFRYGDWRVPDPQWSTEHQDPVLRKAPPAQMVGAAANRPPDGERPGSGGRGPSGPL